MKSWLMNAKIPPLISSIPRPILSEMPLYSTRTDNGAGTQKEHRSRVFLPR
jgi:hypothetical protein